MMKKYHVSFVFESTHERLGYQIEAPNEQAAIAITKSYGAEKSDYECEEIKKFRKDIPIIYYHGAWSKVM